MRSSITRIRSPETRRIAANIAKMPEIGLFRPRVTFDPFKSRQG
jgi:hypothetical protein